MAKGSSLGANPAEAYRKQMQKRETKRNKEVRDKMREANVLYKDTAIMERKIEQFRGILRTRRMTAGEKEKLKSMEAELTEVTAKQKEAGIAPRKHNSDEKAVGFDPLAIATESKNALVQYASSEEENTDNDSTHQTARIGEAVLIEGDIFDTIKDRGSNGEGHGDSNSKSSRIDKAIDPNTLPPLPPGTPPLLSEDLDSGSIWPPLPSGPSPLFIQHNPHTSALSQQRSQTRGRGRGSGRSRGRAQRQHPYDRYPKGPNRHHISNTDAVRPPRSNNDGVVSPGAPYPIPTTVHNIAAYRPPQSQPRMPAGPVLAAEPQVRDLKKELTTLVPSAIARKSKQKERQRVLSAVPTAPMMVVNAAPDVDGEANGNGSGHTKSTSGNALGTMRQMDGVRFSTASKSNNQLRDTASSNAVSNNQKQAKDGDKNALDDEYQRFMDQVNRLQ
ncbi:hypothetical protein H4R24_003105 [Coemansia sp. RSA 988]|nr:hypothetical protein H4R24_003105 [Coemansia sp. RSA 988]